MKWLKIILLLLLPMNCLAQVWGFLPYKNDNKLSDKNGDPLDSFAYYFPLASFTDSVHWVGYLNTQSGLHAEKAVGGDCKSRDTVVHQLSRKYNLPLNAFTDRWEKKTDSFLLSWFSFTLYKMNEPLLSNFYSGHEVYRFTWIRSFNEPVVIRVDKTDKGILMTTKKLGGHPPTVPYAIARSRQTFPALDYPAAYSYNPFWVDTTRNMNEEDFTELISLIDTVKLYSLPSMVHHQCLWGSDGAEWIIEAQKADGYYCAYRWSPRKHTPLNDVGRLMIKLSGLRHERIY